MHFGKTPIFVLVAGGLLGTLGFASLLFSLTGHSKQAMVPNLASHAVIAGLASDGVPSSATGTPDPTPTAVPTATPGVPSVKGLQVWAGGDSVGAFVAQNFAQDMVAAGAKDDCSTTSASTTGVDNTCYFWKISTGLCRLDYFDWLGKLQQIMATTHPQLMLFMLGGNDAQMLIGADGTASGLTPFSQAWNAGYAARVSQAMDIMTSGGGYLVWVGLPIMLDTNEYPGYNANMQQLNAIFKAEAASHSHVVYLDAYALTSDANGQWAEYLPDIHGVVQQMRVPEGVHLTEQGGEFLAQHAIEALFALMKQEPASTP